MKNSLIKNFKDYFETETGVRLDFRTHQFLDNQYNATPCFDYEMGKLVTSHLYKWLDEFILENEENYPGFGGWVYNLRMSVEQLRTTRLKDIITEKCEQLEREFKKV